MQKNQESLRTYKTPNPYTCIVKIREIAYFSDVPHLMKTNRNCVANSIIHSHTKALWEAFHLASIYNYALYMYP